MIAEEIADEIRAGMLVIFSYPRGLTVNCCTLLSGEVFNG